MSKIQFIDLRSLDPRMSQSGNKGYYTGYMNTSNNTSNHANPMSSVSVSNSNTFGKVNISNTFNTQVRNNGK